MLPINDNEVTIVNSYLHRYADCDMLSSVDRFLAPWHKNKKLLFKMLGNKLEQSWKIDNSVVKAQAISEITHYINYNVIPDTILHFADLINSRQKHYVNSNFIYMDGNNAINNRLDKDYEFVIGDKTFSFKAGEKYLKDFKKVTDYLLETYGKALENNYFINQTAVDNYISNLSMYIQKAKEECEVTLSIHPMDFLTMSDNEESWTSCMGVKKHGCYRLGTLEMLSSPNVVCAYIKSTSKKIKVHKDGMWNSKKWRQLFIVDKRFILSGKSYPNKNCPLTDLILDKIADLCVTNLHWDMHTKEISDYRYYDDSRNIKPISHFMYNDYKANPDYAFRIKYADNFNPRKHSILVNYSGPVYCLQCGRKLNNKNTADSSQYFCTKCGSHNKKNPTCPICNTRISAANSRVYLDEDTKCETPYHTFCFDKGVFRDFRGKQHFHASTETIKFRFESDEWLGTYSVILTKEDFNKFVAAEGLGEFEKLSDLSYKYTGLIKSYDSFKSYIKKVVLAA